MSQDIKVSEGTVLEALNNKVDLDFDNVASNSVSFARMSREVTNCITEIPQRIKVELTDSNTIVLKAGSILIVPNGFEEDGVTRKFDEKIIENDIIKEFVPTRTGKCLIELQEDDSMVFSAGDNSIQYYYSGDTQPTIPSSTVYGHWFDTANNIMKYTSDSGKTWQEGLTLPFAELEYVSTGSLTNIKALNGMGYIGSTIWVDKGVKGLVADGRNEDGTLRTKLYSVDKLCLCLNPATRAKKGDITVNENDEVYEAAMHYKVSSDGYIYNELGEYRNPLIVGQYVTDATGNVTKLDIKQPFRAVDYNDVATIVETYVSDTSGYRVWSDGYCEQWGRIIKGTAGTITVNLLKTMKDTNYLCQVTLFDIDDNGYGNAITGTYYMTWSLTTTSFKINRAVDFCQAWKVSGYIA